MPHALRSAWVCALAVCAAVGTGASAWAAGVLPLEQFSGYTLDYGISWNGIPAAHAEVSLTSESAGTPQATHELDVASWTLPLLRWIWPASNTVHSTVAHDLSSRRFYIFRRERRKEQSTEITFDPVLNEVRVVRRKPSGRIKTTTLPLADLRDPASLLYVMRQQPTTLGSAYEGHVIVSNDVYRVTVTVVDRGTMRVGKRRVPVVCVTPAILEIKEDGTEEPLDRLKSARIWVTDDALRLPVRISARAFIGRVTMALHRVTPPLETLYARAAARSALLAEVELARASAADQPG